MSSLHVIVNADDLGASDDVNAAVFDLMCERRVLSATLLANGPAIHSAIAELRHFPYCSFGVHLNVTEFEPVSAGPDARSLVDRQRRLSRDIESASANPTRLRAIYREFCAQIERLAAMGVGITHLDSHHHVHTKPFIFPVLKAVQRRYGIRKVRITKNLYTADCPAPPALVWRKRAYNCALRVVYRTCTTDAFTEFASFLRLDGSQLRAPRTIEVMVHPGDPRHAAETAALQSNWTAASSRPVELISYAQLENVHAKPN